MKAKSETCIDGLRKKYAGRSAVFAQEVHSKIRQRCPRPELSTVPAMGGVPGTAADPVADFLLMEGAPPRQ